MAFPKKTICRVRNKRLGSREQWSFQDAVRDYADFECESKNLLVFQLSCEIDRYTHVSRGCRWSTTQDKVEFVISTKFVASQTFLFSDELYSESRVGNVHYSFLSRLVALSTKVGLSGKPSAVGKSGKSTSLGWGRTGKSNIVANFPHNWLTASGNCWQINSRTDRLTISQFH